MEFEGDEAIDGTPKRRNPEKHSEDSNSSLPQELIRNILVRLPVKHLLRFKCVSKEWFDLISSHEFAKSHLCFSAKDHNRHRILLKGLGYSYCSLNSLFSGSPELFGLYDPSLEFYSIWGSVNGLICMGGNFDRLFLWNPMLRKFREVVDVHRCEQRLQEAIYGFGYDEVHDDYKVVSILGDFSRNHLYDSKIYSLRRDSWRRLDGLQSVPVNRGSPPLVNGRLHWLTFDVDDGFVIMFVDLVDEKCGKVEQPCHGEGHFTLTLGVVGSDLCMYCMHNDYDNPCHIDVWAMKEYGVEESWTKLCTINYPNDHERHCMFTRLCMSNKEEILFLLGTTLAIYNPRDDSFRYTEVANDAWFKVELYIESLVWPAPQTDYEHGGKKGNILQKSHPRSKRELETGRVI